MIPSQNDSVPLLPSKAKQKGWFNCTWSVISIALIFTALICYLSFNHFNGNERMSDSKFYEEADEEEGDKKERVRPGNTIEINYNAQDLITFQESKGIETPILPNTALWTEFHEQMIISAGYDPESIRNDPETIVNFHAHDDGDDIDEYLEDMEIVSIYTIKKKRKRRQDLNRKGMHCYTSFNFLDERPGARTCINNMGCEAWRETGKYLGIGARCCVLEDAENNWFTSWDSGLVGGGSGISKTYHELTVEGNGATSDRCSQSNCHTESGGYDITLGCAGGQGSGWSKASFGRNYAGQKQVGNVCTTQRADDGFKNSYGVCGNVNNGAADLQCNQVYSDSAVYKKDDVYYSTVTCPKGRAMTDCNGYIDEQIDVCSGDPFTAPDVVYGEMISGAECVAVGNTDKVRSQANCCRVDYV